MFVRKKIVRGVTYYALVESYRKDGKVRQRTLYSLGRESSFDLWIERAKKQLARQKSPESQMLVAMIGRGAYARMVLDTQNWLDTLRAWKAKLDGTTETCSLSTTCATTKSGRVVAQPAVSGDTATTEFESLVAEKLSGNAAPDAALKDLSEGKKWW